MKNILKLLVLLFISAQAFAQPKNWHHLDLETDNIFGISTNKAYNELLKGKKAVAVIVGVIDSGVDTTHEDLTAVLWKNKREAKRRINGRDDDHNNYIDDINGWSFLGTKEKNIQYDNLEITRMLREKKQRGDTTGEYIALKKIFDEKLSAAFTNLKNWEAYKEQLEKSNTLTESKKEQVTGAINHFKAEIDYQLNLAYDPRAGLMMTGVNDVNGPAADHGTHVSGIIAAVRSNNKGIEGIASNAKIMVLRAVPDGDEGDEDIAKAIIYAVSNGARVINMSFGKSYSPGKRLVDDAVRFAMAKDVLLIHAAGNEGKDIDKAQNYPTSYYMDSTQANAWLEVGASGWKNNKDIAAGFSNYGKLTVDVFAPGVNIYSTIPGSKYTTFNGTSMAAPVVAGVAALIRGYYPRLTAVQVKEIIMNSVTKAELLTDKCKTGGVVNAYEALKLAATYK